MKNSEANFRFCSLDESTHELITEGCGQSRLRVYDGEGNITLSDTGNYFGLVVSGEVELEQSCGKFSLKKGMYFSSHEDIMLSGIGTAILINKLNWQGLFSIGGPIEDKGRLRYIDGCSDTLLISPTEKGDACLNYLYFPEQIDQTLHTHPSVRIGYVFEGSGICKTPEKTFDLKEGSLFIIPAEVVHAFKTTSSSMKIVAYHPDSDFGPTHEDHPMINKTIVDGVSAKHIDSIQTKSL
ncbi:MAG: cupin domain-containing protein [Lentisphaeraceae bacterium]|nr:cupin domain-containing protein [Lentisphaeraceae bacterium]